MKIEFRTEGVVPPKKISDNIDNAKWMNFPYPSPGNSRKLAVVGASPSIKDHMKYLRYFDGDIWVIGSAFQWARSQGIYGTYFSIDPNEGNVKEVLGVTKAIVASCVDPLVLSTLKSDGCDISVFDLVNIPGRLNHGCTTATAVPELAVILDYTEITFFGCESSLPSNESEDSHVSGNFHEPKWFIIKCDGKSYATRPDYFMQAQMLSFIIRALPKFFKEESGGLLRAMVNDQDYDVTHVSPMLHEILTFKEAI